MTATTTRPGLVARIRSRQSGHPTGLLGRIFGRVMVKDTAEANDCALALLDLSSTRTVLEVGFGQGRTAAILLDAGHRILGADSSQTMVKQATARNRRACREGRAVLRLSDGTAIPFADQLADAAFTAHTIYFMPDPTVTLSEVARVLRPGGTVVIACRTADDPRPAWMDPAVYRIPTAEQITTMLNAAGFTGVEHRCVDTASHPLHLFAAHLPNSAQSSTPEARLPL